MTRPMLLAFALLALSAAPAPSAEPQPVASPETAPAPSPSPFAADAQALVQEATELWQIKNDYNGALAAFNRAVDAAPDDGLVRIRRAHFFEVVAGLVRNEEVEKFKELARSDYRWVAEQAPDTIGAGVARDGLTRLSGKPLLVRPRVDCPKDAVEAHARAESMYIADRPAEAVPEYHKAVKSCPGAAAYWVDYADAYYVSGRYEDARKVFRRALEADPWSREAHRFLADTEARLGDLAAALRESALAVVSDPVYEAAWASLRSYAGATGRRYDRVYGRKTELTSAVGADGKQSVKVILPADENERKSAGSPQEAVSADGVGWMSYGMAKVNALAGSVFETNVKGETVERKIDPKTTSALEMERIGAHTAIQVLRETASHPPSGPGPFWAMMDRADRAGFLDEAIFLHLLDAPLAAEYPAFREKNSARLVEYLERVIVPNW